MKIAFKGILCNFSTFILQLRGHFDGSPTCNRELSVSSAALAHLHTENQTCKLNSRRPVTQSRLARIHRLLYGTTSHQNKLMVTFWFEISSCIDTNNQEHGIFQSVHHIHKLRVKLLFFNGFSQCFSLARTYLN